MVLAEERTSVHAPGHSHADGGHFMPNPVPHFPEELIRAEASPESHGYYFSEQLKYIFDNYKEREPRFIDGVWQERSESKVGEFFKNPEGRLPSVFELLTNYADDAQNRLVIDSLTSDVESLVAMDNMWQIMASDYLGRLRGSKEACLELDNTQEWMPDKFTTAGVQRHFRRTMEDSRFDNFIGVQALAMNLEEDGNIRFKTSSLSLDGSTEGACNFLTYSKQDSQVFPEELPLQLEFDLIGMSFLDIATIPSPDYSVEDIGDNELLTPINVNISDLGSNIDGYADAISSLVAQESLDHPDGALYSLQFLTTITNHFVRSQRQLIIDLAHKQHGNRETNTQHPSKADFNCAKRVVQLMQNQLTIAIDNVFEKVVPEWQEDSYLRRIKGSIRSKVFIPMPTYERSLNPEITEDGYNWGNQAGVLDIQAWKVDKLGDSLAAEYEAMEIMKNKAKRHRSQGGHILARENPRVILRNKSDSLGDKMVRNYLNYAHITSSMFALESSGISQNGIDFSSVSNDIATFHSIHGTNKYLSTLFLHMFASSDIKHEALAHHLFDHLGKLDSKYVDEAFGAINITRKMLWPEALEKLIRVLKRHQREDRIKHPKLEHFQEKRDSLVNMLGSKYSRWSNGGFGTNRNTREDLKRIAAESDLLGSALFYSTGKYRRPQPGHTVSPGLAFATSGDRLPSTSEVGNLSEGVELKPVKKLAGQAVVVTYTAHTDNTKKSQPMPKRAKRLRKIFGGLARVFTEKDFHEDTEEGPFDENKVINTPLQWKEHNSEHMVWLAQKFGVSPQKMIYFRGYDHLMPPKSSEHGCLLEMPDFPAMYLSNHEHLKTLTNSDFINDVRAHARQRQKNIYLWNTDKINWRSTLAMEINNVYDPLSTIFLGRKPKRSRKISKPGSKYEQRGSRESSNVAGWENQNIQFGRRKGRYIKH